MPRETEHVEVTGETLLGVELFRSLGAGERRRLATRCHGRLYPAGRQILSHHDAGTEVCFVVSGRVRVTIYSVSGKEITFRDQGPGEMFGELSAIDGEPRSAYVVALDDALVVSIPAAAFWEAIREHPPVAAATLRRLTRLVRLLSDRVFEFSTLGVKNRIHAELLRLARDGAAEDGAAVIAPAPTHADIASRVSTHREAVTRELNALAHAGVLEKRRGALVIRDVDRLALMVQEVLGD